MSAFKCDLIVTVVQVHVKTNDMELAGNIIQDLANFMSITELECQAEVKELTLYLYLGCNRVRAVPTGNGAVPANV